MFFGWGIGLDWRGGRPARLGRWRKTYRGSCRRARGLRGITCSFCWGDILVWPGRPSVRGVYSPISVRTSIACKNCQRRAMGWMRNVGPSFVDLGGITWIAMMKSAIEMVRYSPHVPSVAVRTCLRLVRARRSNGYWILKSMRFPHDAPSRTHHSGRIWHR
jgi:hypothetical protein